MRPSVNSSAERLGHLLPNPAAQAYVLLVFTTLIWGANAVAARLAVGEVSPMLLTFMRWFICLVALLLTSRGTIRAHWHELRPHWRYLAMMGTLGFTGFNALFYGAAHHTTAINIAIIQGTIPVLVLVFSAVFFSLRVRPLQWAGVLATLAGIAVVASAGQLAVLAHLQFNAGDLWMILACLLYTVYALGLPRRPQVPAIVFFAAVALVACITALPLVIAEAATGRLILPTLQGWAVVTFVGLLPSFVSQITFIQAVGLIGPARAGMFLNLVPIFGPLLAVLVLGEPMALYHGVALALVLGGIWLAERRRG